MEDIVSLFALGALGSFAVHIVGTTFRLPFMVWRLARKLVRSRFVAGLRERYLFWRYPELTPEQERAIWAEHDHACWARGEA